jgi:hypothetical protein
MPTLLTQALIIPETKTAEGILIKAVAIPWRKILELLIQDPSRMFEIDPWKWEEIIAASYQDSGECHVDRHKSNFENKLRRKPGQFSKWLYI